MKRTSIFMFDDYALLRRGLLSFLSSQGNYSIVGETANEGEALRIIGREGPDVILFDTPLSCSNIGRLVRKMRKKSPGSKTVYFPLRIRPFLVRRMVGQGLNGCISKHASLAELMEGIEEVTRSGFFFCECTKQGLIDHSLQLAAGGADITHLSEREYEVAELIAHGNTSKQVSTELGICYKSVDVHRHRILKKLQLKNIAALVSLINQ